MQEFIKINTTGKYSQYNKDVISFIANIVYHSGEQGAETIHDLFRNGYCYWFAHMLMVAFDRGRLCMTYPFGHIVWQDDDGLSYDVEGAYHLDDTDCEALIPMKFFGDIQYDFMHIPNKEYRAEKDFHEWAQFMYMTDVYATTKIFIEMPKENIDYEQDDCSTVVYSYWVEHRQELQEQMWELRRQLREERMMNNG